MNRAVPPRLASVPSRLPIVEGASGAYTVEPDTRILAGAATIAIGAYIVSLTAQPSGNVTVAIASDNPDVTVRPASLTFTPSKWDTAQAVLVIARADAGGDDWTPCGSQRKETAMAAKSGRCWYQWTTRWRRWRSTRMRRPA